MDKQIKVLGIVRDTGACGVYRIQQPLTKVAEQDLADVAIYDSSNKKDTLYELLKEADIVFVPRVQGLEWIDFVKACQDDGKKIIIDHDDDLFNVNPYSPHYIDSGTKEVKNKDKNGKFVYLWKHGMRKGEDVFDIEKNIIKMEAAKECLRMADAITVTTDELKKVYQKYNENVFVLPNCVDLTIWHQPEMVKNGNIRVSWHGGFSHYVDLWTIEEALAKVMTKYPNVTLVLVGHKFKGLFKDIDPDRIEYHKWVATAAHPYKQALLNTDIAIIPLEDNPFNRCKSALKYIEYSALKIPSVVAGIPPYSPVINDNVDACLFNSKKEFIKKLTYLIESEEARKRIGKAAFENVKQNFDADGQAFQWANVFRFVHESSKRIITNI